MNDLVKCSRCKKTLIAESFKDHNCAPPLLATKTIEINYYGITKDDNGAKIIIAHGMDGTLYRLVENTTESIPVRFNPPNEIDSENTKQGFDRTSILVLSR